MADINALLAKYRSMNVMSLHSFAKTYHAEDYELKARVAIERVLAERHAELVAYGKTVADELKHYEKEEAKRRLTFLLYVVLCLPVVVGYLLYRIIKQSVDPEDVRSLRVVFCVAVLTYYLSFGLTVTLGFLGDRYSTSLQRWRKSKHDGEAGRYQGGVNRRNNP